jgi:outer membrane murein-binding lipoprotein Lpp
MVIPARGRYRDGLNEGGDQMKLMVGLAALAMLAGCGEAEKEKAKASEVSAIAPGLYQVTREVTAFRQTDRAPTPQINTPAGTRSTDSICVAAGAEPNGELFAGAGSTCTYDNHYLRRGRLNSSLVCRRDGLGGEIRMTAYGTVAADGFEVNVDTTTYLNGDGDAAFTTRTVGRRTGDCQPGAQQPGNGAGAAKQ